MFTVYNIQWKIAIHVHFNVELHDSYDSFIPFPVWPVFKMLWMKLMGLGGYITTSDEFQCKRSTIFQMYPTVTWNII